MPHKSGKDPREMQQGTVTALMDNHGFLTMQPDGEEALFYRLGVGEPWGFEDFKIGDKVVCTTVDVRVKGTMKVRAYDVRVLDPRRRPGK
jgi:hypothetical protein